MKLGTNFPLRGKHISVAVITVLFTTILLLLAWKKNPVTSLLSAQDWYSVPSTVIYVNSTNVSPIPKKPKENGMEKSPNLLIKEETKNVVEDLGPTPMGPSSTFLPVINGSNADVISSNKTKVCNYANGRWLKDSKHPVYSGFRCKQWLSGMWACRLTQRIDFSYEEYRWLPQNCQIADFSRSEFLQRMKDKTIAFIGDSLGRQQFQSLMCMATGGAPSPEVEDVGKEYGLIKAKKAIRPDGWAYRFPTTNTTILYYWSASLSDLESLNISDPATNIAMHLDRAPSFMRRYLHRFDVLVLNTGHHWNRGKLRANRWVMYIGGKPCEETKRMDISKAKNFTVYSVVKWLDSQLPLHPRLKVFFRTISPRHFANGEWNTGGSCDNTVPLLHGSEVEEGFGSTDLVVEGALKDTNVQILDITALSQLRDEGHISRYSIKGRPGGNDCLHWCLPGIPDTWNEILMAQI